MLRRKIKAVFLSVLVVITAMILVACAPDASVVKDGSPYDYPDKTWGEALDDVCKKGDWDSFVSDDDEDIVEFNGVLKENDVELCIQFKVDDDEFEIKYMEVDGESCNELEMSEIVALIFEN